MTYYLVNDRKRKYNIIFMSLLVDFSNNKYFEHSQSTKNLVYVLLKRYKTYFYNFVRPHKYLEKTKFYRIFSKNCVNKY